MGDRDWLHLPPEFGGNNDPVGANPFPPESGLHQIWADATAIAHREFLDLQRYLADPKRLSEISGPAEWWVVPQAAKFDIWAKRSAYVVYSEGSLAAYEKWLRSYANSWLDASANFFEKSPPPFPSEPVLIALRNLLAARVIHWRNEGRRFMDAQIEFRRNAEPPRDVSPAVKQKRKALVSAYKRKHELTAQGLAQRVAISTTGIVGLVNEDRTRFSDATQANFLRHLGISKEDWYSA